MYIWISKITFNFVAVVCLKLYTVDVCYISWDIFVSGITEITDADATQPGQATRFFVAFFFLHPGST